MTSIIFGIIYFLLVFICGYAVALLLPRSKMSLGEIFPFGFGVTGLIFFGLKLLMGYVDMWLFIFAQLLFAGLIAIYLKLKKREMIVPIPLQIFDFVILGFLLVYALQNRFGGFDAWAVWNTKAKYMASGVTIMEAFSGFYVNNDYPLLLPSIIAGGWTATCSTSFWIPVLVAVLYAWSLYLLFKATLSYLFGSSNNNVVYYCSLLLLSVPVYLWWSISQYADIVIASYLFLSISLLYRSQKSPAYLLSGLAFGFALFTKNEGLLYLGLLIISFIYASSHTKLKTSMFQVIVWGVGLLPGLISTMLVKTNFRANNYLTGNTYAQVSLERLLTMGKIALHELLFWRRWMFFWPVAIALFLLTKPEKKYYWDIFVSTFIVLSFLMHLMIFFLAPQEIHWVMECVYSRLLTQILPVFVFIVLFRLKIFFNSLNANTEKNE